MNLWLDDYRDPALWAPERHWVWAKTAPEAIAHLASGVVTFASLDHDLGLCDDCWSHQDRAAVKAALIRNPGCASYSSCPHVGTGYDVVLWMEEHGVWPSDGVVVHSVNPVGRARMEAAIARQSGRRQ